VTIDEVRRFFNAKPFAPFTLYLADGRQFPVASREFMALSPLGRTVAVYQPDGMVDVIDLLLVTSLKASVPDNGSPKRRAKGRKATAARANEDS
jgi:hypothetical protein